MKRGSAALVAIDGDKLRALIRAQGLTVSQAGIAIGMSTSAVNNPCRRGEIAPYLAKLIEMELGIKLEEYMIQQPTTEVVGQCEACGAVDGIPCVKIDGRDPRFGMDLMFFPAQKYLTISSYFGDTEICEDRAFINYCPYCGRKL